MANNFIDIPKMRMFCHKVLPLVYDDSLSYYEVLCKVVFKLNEVISNVEKLPEYIAELISDERLREILSTLLDKLQEQIASANEGESETATADRNIGDLVWLNGYLYRVTKQMDAGDRYVSGSNCEAITIENLFDEVITTIAPFVETNDNVASRDLDVGDLVWWKNKLYEVTSPIAESEGYAGRVRLVTIEMLLYNEKTARTDADTALGTRIDNEVTARQNADTALSERIDDEVEALETQIDNEETARTNADTALGTRIDNEVTARTDADTALQNAINALKNKIYDVRDYGIFPDNNVYDELYDLMQLVNENGGGIVYFPKGKYTIDFTIFIPSNTIMIGEGDATIIYFDNTDTWFGCALCNGGSDIRIINMDVEQASNVPYNVIGALPNSIGIGDVDFNSITAKRAHSVGRHEGNKNIYLINVNSHNCNYGIQVEPGEYKVSNIFVVNHVCENGMFSISPNSNDPFVENFYANNIVCDTLRFGDGRKGAVNCNVNGLYCTQMVIKCPVTISDFTLYSGDGNRIVSSQNYDGAIVVANDNITISNGVIKRDENSRQIRAISTMSDPGYVKHINLSNIRVDNPDAFNANLSNAPHLCVSHSNCNFTPYRGRETVTMTNAVSAIPPVVHYNGCPGQSEISGLFSYTFNADSEQIIGTINNLLLTNEIAKYGVAPCILYNLNDNTVEPDYGIVKITEDGNITVYRKTPKNNSYNCVEFSLKF